MIKIEGGERYQIRCVKLWETYNSHEKHIATHFTLSEALDDLRRHHPKVDTRAGNPRYQLVPRFSKD